MPRKKQVDNVMRVRYNFKLIPNRTQTALMDEWLITLRKQYNYSLGERDRGYKSNNQFWDVSEHYTDGSRCDINSREVFGALCCTLTCPLRKHGVQPLDIPLTKTTRAKVDKKTGMVVKPSKTSWDLPGGIQSKALTQFRKQSYYAKRVHSDVLQRNLARLDAAFSRFYKGLGGFPTFRRAHQFTSFEYKPTNCKFEFDGRDRKHRISKVYLPFIGWMRFHDSRSMEGFKLGSVTITKKADGWYMSVLVDVPNEIPQLPVADVKGAKGVDLGINKLASFSDGSFAENPRFATNKAIRRRLRIRQRRVNRKVQGSRNRKKSGVEVAKLHRKVTQRRDAYQWKVAKQAHRKVDAVVVEDLNIRGMKAKCKPKKCESGRFLPNGQSAKRGLNHAISDASWGSLIEKIEWIGVKTGHPVIKVAPQYSSQECRKCGHVSKLNRNGEKFVCENCGHLDHADTQASRTIVERAGFVFGRNKSETLPGDSRKVTPVRYESTRSGKQIRGRNLVALVVNEDIQA